MNQSYATSKQPDPKAFNSINALNPIDPSNPVKLVLMLYDGSITYLKKAIEYAEKGDIRNKNIYTNKARNIIVELNNALNFEVGGETAKVLRSLYAFMDQHLTKTNQVDDTQGLNEVSKMLSSLRGGWQYAADLTQKSNKKCLEMVR